MLQDALTWLALMVTLVVSLVFDVRWLNAVMLTVVSALLFLEWRGRRRDGGGR